MSAVAHSNCKASYFGLLAMHAVILFVSGIALQNGVRVHIMFDWQLLGPVRPTMWGVGLCVFASVCVVGS